MDLSDSLSVFVMDDDPPVASTETQLLNRDIELIYKALRDERDNRQESDSDDGDDSDVKFGYQIPGRV